MTRINASPNLSIPVSLRDTGHGMLRRTYSLPKTTLSRLFACAAIAVTLALGWQIEAAAAPKSKLWAYWDSANDESTRAVDHGAWNTLLATYLRSGDDGVNRFDYGSVSATDKQALKSYLSTLAATDVLDLNRDEQYAYWVNMYNALTVDVILDHYPLDSILDISSGLFSKGPWKKKIIAVSGQELSLDDIEHRILRPIWRDPRTHYAVNCASLGCPNLQPEAFTAANTERLLEQGALEYINHPRGIAANDPADLDGLIVSSIYVWFAEDFGSEQDLVAHFRRYAGPALNTLLDQTTEIDDDRYDWQLNDA